MTQDPSLELSKYKDDNKKHQVGDVSLVIEKTKNGTLEKNFGEYLMYITQKGEIVYETKSILDIKCKNIIAESMKKGTDALIVKLKSFGRGSSKNVALLQEALDEKNKTALKIG